MGLVLTERTDELITLSCLGAVVVYAVSMLSLFVLRKKEPELERPFVTPAYPAFPAVALAIAVLAFVAFAASSPRMLGVFLGLLLAGTMFFFFVTLPRTKAR
jgi:ethanolamine permease